MMSEKVTALCHIFLKRREKVFLKPSGIIIEQSQMLEVDVINNSNLFEQLKRRRTRKNK